jgi:ubiquinone/menaquinone biosynthesis C-methylase UbiE
MWLKLIGNDTDDVRVSWVKNALSKVPAGARLLDAGAGELRFKPDCSHLDYVAQDFGQYDGTGEEGLQTGDWDNDRLDIVSDITSIPVPDASFDAILCSEVLEHIPDAVAALNEFTRILKPGGILLITAPFASLTHFAPYHFCGYNKYWYEHHLPKLGFEIELLEHNGSWFHFVAQELRRSRFIGRMYSNKFLGLLTRLAVIPIIVLLSISSRFDRGSHEAMCFNYMVRAVKKA